MDDALTLVYGASMVSSLQRAALLASIVSTLSCSKSPSPSATGSTSLASSASSASSSALKLPPIALTAGAAAPSFEATDLDGKKFSLAEHQGKIVVLEWFNPQCPFVVKSHTVGSLVDTAKRHTAEGVVWVAINSGAPGKQGHGVETNKQGATTFGLSHPILIDETGEIGRKYGAKRTPHMVVIAADGMVAYQGAIDNSPDAEKQSPTGGTLVNYVDATIDALKQGNKPEVTSTEAYGCSVKYGS